MAGRGRALAFAGALALGSLAAAVSSSAVTGTPAAQRLAAQEIAATRAVAVIRIHQTGDVFLCERSDGGIGLYTGAPGRIPARERACYRRASKVVYVALANGIQTRRLETDHVPGGRDQLIFDDAGGEYFQLAGAGCWTHDPRIAPLGGPFARGFAASERLTTGPPQGGLDVLRGTTRRGGAIVRELDLIDPVTHLERREVDTTQGPGALRFRVVEEISAPASFPSVSPAPVCDRPAVTRPAAG